MSKKVIVAGHICLDITPVFPDKTINKVSDLLCPGKLIEMQNVDVHTGGAVANTGLAMKFLGMDVALMGKIGADAFGEMVLNMLSKYNAQKEMIISDRESTSYSIVLALPGIDRIFLHNPGANNTFCAADIRKEALEEANLLHFGYPPLMAGMYRDKGKELLILLKQTKSMGVATSLDLAAVDENSAAAEADWKQILKALIPYVDFFVPSVEELCYMIDKDRFEQWKKRAAGGDITEILDIENDVKPLANHCMEWGAKVLLIKCGSSGMYYRTADKKTLEDVGIHAGLKIGEWADKEGFEKSYVPDKILSGTGAGDTSIAAFLTAMLEGRTPEDCVRLSAATGASCVAAYDALSGLKPLDELQHKIDCGWKKVSV